MAHTVPCEMCNGLGGRAVIEGEYPTATVLNEKCRWCAGKGRITDPCGR